MAFMEQCREGVRDVGTPTLEAFFELFRDSEPHLRLVDSRGAQGKQLKWPLSRADSSSGHRFIAPRSSEQVPLELRMREIEETSVRVFETLAKRAELLVDSLTKSPAEFWKARRALLGRSSAFRSFRCSSNGAFRGVLGAAARCGPPSTPR